MLNGGLSRKIIKVALPLAAISMLQQLFNAADVAVVGRFGSPNALAAVGANVTVVNMFLTFFTGLATGGNVCLSTYIGEGKTERVNRAVHTLMSLSLISALLVVIIGELLARPLLIWMNTPENILPLALLYLRIYMFAVMFAVIYNFAAAILRSVGDTKRPLYALIFSGILNIVLNLIFVVGCGLDVAGVALATVISNFVCALITLHFLFLDKGMLKFSFKHLALDKSALLFALRIGLPTGIQGTLFSLSNMIIQSGINSFGADSIAGNTAAVNFEYITYFVVNAFGQTATTFVSQNYGAGKCDRARRSLKLCMAFSIGISLIVGMTFLAGSRFFIGLFTDSDPVYEYAHIRMCYVVALEFLTSFNEMGSAGLRGRGISLPPTIISIMGSCVFRIIWMNTVFVWFNSPNTLMLVYPVSWILIGIAMMIAYFHARRRDIMPAAS